MKKCIAILVFVWFMVFAAKGQKAVNLKGVEVKINHHHNITYITSKPIVFGNEVIKLTFAMFSGEDGKQIFTPIRIEKEPKGEECNVGARESKRNFKRFQKAFLDLGGGAK